MPQRRAHPFLTLPGCGAALAFALILGAIIYWQDGRPFSPGPLTAARPQGQPLDGFASHADLENDCGRCHTPWRGVAAARCESCHTTVAQQRTGGEGLHGLLPDAGRCQSCHTEHQGREAIITSLTAAGFDHDRLTGFSLARHETSFDGAPMACADCHAAPRFDAAAVDCVTCHRDADPPFMVAHVELFGDNCLACHDGRDRLADFNHDLFFPLDGAHASVTCESCHAGRLFAGTPTDCAGCHQEPAIHAGLFGLDCVRCHTTAAWTPAQLTQHTFPLDHGGEGIIACETCHEQSYVAYTCYDCHQHEPADIREEHLDEGIREFEDCVECHPTGRKDEAEDRRDG